MGNTTPSVVARVCAAGGPPPQAFRDALRLVCLVADLRRRTGGGAVLLAGPRVCAPPDPQAEVWHRPVLGREHHVGVVRHQHETFKANGTPAEPQVWVCWSKTTPMFPTALAAFVAADNALDADGWGLIDNPWRWRVLSLVLAVRSRIWWRR